MSASRSCALRLILSVGLLGFAMAVPQWRRGLDGSEYLIEVDQKYNWFEASHICAGKNLRLAEIESAQQNKALLMVLKTFLGNSRNLWLGANDDYNSSTDRNRAFYWSSGKRMTFKYWSIENPNNAASNEHCTHIWANKSDYEWNDNVCTAKLGFICENKTL